VEDGHEGATAAGVSLTLRWLLVFFGSPNNTLPPVQVLPGLLRVLYLQLYLWLTDHRSLRRCQAYPTLFVLAKRDKKYCSTSCRVAADRVRMNHREGNPP
jgi:hypothetical protein